MKIAIVMEVVDIIVIVVDVIVAIVIDMIAIDMIIKVNLYCYQ